MSSPFASTRGRGRGRASHGRARGEIFCGRGRGEASRRGRGGEEFALAGERGHARGRGRGNARSRGRRDVSIGRGRGAHISNNGQEDRLSLREHANASSIPLHRRHRIYLPIDDSSSQAPAPLSGQQNDAEQGPTENNLHPPPNQVLDNPDSDVVMNGAESSHRWRGHVRTASLSNAGRSSWQQEAREQTPSLSLEETSAITAWTEAVAPGAQFESGPWESEPASQGSTAMNPDFEGIGPDDAYPPFVQRFRSSSTAQTATARPEETAASEPVVATLSEQSPALEHGSVLDEIADLLPDAADLIIFDDGEHVAVEEEAENEVEESVHEAGATNSPS
ncbi:MAG: hypothetical protein LQ338_008169, partial [Usnochroma carphineum]